MTTILFFFSKKYGTTLMEVDGNGSLSYPEPRNTTKDNGNVIFVKMTIFFPLCFYHLVFIISIYFIGFLFHILFLRNSIFYCLQGSILCQLKSILGQNLLVLNKKNV